jgi:D-lactate dehydrogenase (cytochrome)
MSIALANSSARGRNAVGSAIAELELLLGDRLLTDEAALRTHTHTTTGLPAQLPDAVAFPESTEEVAQIVKVAGSFGAPIIPFGAGSSLEGHVNAPFGGISVDLRRMNRVLAVRPSDLDCTVEAGVTREQLNERLRSEGYFFPVDPGANSTLGGMAATRASGTTTVRYGSMRDNVVSLKAVMADGSVVTTAGRARKSSAGYDLTRLLIGSEGTLGIITELTLRMYGVPASIAGGYCPFPSIGAACDATILAIQSGIPVARIELLEPVQIRASNRYSNLTLAEVPSLFLEFHGTEAAVAEQARAFGAIAETFGGGPFAWDSRPEERERFWKARKDAFWAASAIRPNVRTLSTDVCVPLSRLADCVRETEADLKQHGLVAPILGHVGDGNFHVLLAVDWNDPAEAARADGFMKRLAARAIVMDGTCTGEHGIGQGKMAYLLAEHGAAGVQAMRAIKSALDPLGIMNPGKILPG